MAMDLANEFNDPGRGDLISSRSFVMHSTEQQTDEVACLGRECAPLSTEAIYPPVRTTLPQPRLRKLLILPFRPLPDLVLERPQFDLGDVELVPRPPEVRVARGVLAERPLPQQVPRLVHRPTQRQRLAHALEMK